MCCCFFNIYYFKNIREDLIPISLGISVGLVGLPNKAFSKVVLKRVGQAVCVLRAELQKRLLGIDNYFLSLHFNICIFSTVSCPIFPRPKVWFYFPQRINSPSSATIGKGNNPVVWNELEDMGAYFYLKVLSVTIIFVLCLLSFPEVPSATRSQIYNAKQVLQLSISFPLPDFHYGGLLSQFFYLCVFMTSCCMAIIHLLSFCRVQEWREICMVL